MALAPVYHDFSLRKRFRTKKSRRTDHCAVALWLSVPAVSHLALKVLPEQIIHCLHLLRQTLQGFLLQLGRHPVKGFGNAAGDAGKGVAVSSFTPDAAF